MIKFLQLDILFCLSNFILIITSIICAIIKQYYIYEHYRDNLNYYPARNLMVVFYLIPLLDIPYFLYGPNTTSLFYTSVVYLLMVPVMLKLVWEKYYLLISLKKPYEVLHIIIPLLLIIPLIIPVFKEIQVQAYFHQLFFYIAACVFLLTFSSLIWIEYKIYKQVEINYREKNSSPNQNHQQRIITVIIIFPNLLCIFLFLFFLFPTAIFKVCLDWICILIEIITLMYLLSNHRKIRNEMLYQYQDEEKAKKPAEAECHIQEGVQPRVLSKEQCNTLINDIISLLINKELFKDSNLSLNELCSLLGSNRTYVSEAISLSKYGSFYRMVNHFRIKYAMDLMKNDSQMKIDDVAFSSGFSSRFTFTRAFKEFTQTTPSDWKKN